MFEMTQNLVQRVQNLVVAESSHKRPEVEDIKTDRKDRVYKEGSFLNSEVEI